MKRWIAGLVVVIAIVALMWRDDDGAARPGAAATGRATAGATSRTISHALRDTLARVRAHAVAVARAAPGSVTIAGGVFDVRDQTPVAGVEVVFRSPAGELTTTADAAGHYAIVVEPGVYRAFVRDDRVLSVGRASLIRLPGAPPPEAAGAPDESLMTVVVAERDSEGVDLEVLRGGLVTGRVVDRAGRPIAGAILHARSGLRPALATDIAETDRDGSFELRLPAGRVELEASHPRFGGFADPAAQILAIEPGGHLYPTIVLTAGCVITGRVVRADGAPAGDGAIERRWDEPDSFTPDGRIAADGTFRWATTDQAEITLRAWPWHAPPSPSRTFSCGDGVRLDGVVFKLYDQPPDLEGVLVDARGAPVGHAYLDLSPLDPEGIGQQERTDDDGHWAVYNLPRGRYRCTAQADGLGVASQLVASPRAGLRLELGGTGRLTGRAPIARGSFALQINACIDAAGVVGLPPSHRRVTIRDGRFAVDDLPACDLSFTASWNGHSVASHVAIPPGGTAQIDLTAVSAAQAGSAADPDPESEPEAEPEPEAED